MKAGLSDLADILDRSPTFEFSVGNLTDLTTNEQCHFAIFDSPD